MLSNIDGDQFKECPLYIKIILKLLKQKSDELFLHLKYSPGSDGYNKCKTEFFGILAKNETTYNKQIRSYGFVNNKVSRRKSN